MKWQVLLPQVLQSGVKNCITAGSIPWFSSVVAKSSVYYRMRERAMSATWPMRKGGYSEVFPIRVACSLLRGSFAYIPFSELGQAKLKGQKRSFVLSLSIYYVDVRPLVPVKRSLCVLQALYFDVLKQFSIRQGGVCVCTPVRGSSCTCLLFPQSHPP